MRPRLAVLRSASGVFVVLALACGGSEAPPAVAPQGPPAAAPDDPTASVESPAEAPPADAAPASPTWKTTDLGVEVPDDWRSCTAPEDCEIVVTTCCDHCNGGKSVSVNRSRVPDVKKKYAPTGCGACTERGCMTRPFCEGGRCVLQWESR